MRILHTADWHLGRSLEQHNRLDEQAAFLEELAGICQDRAVDLLLVTGDIFDTYNPPAAAETLFYDALERLSGQGRRGIVVIAGNHDNPERLSAAAPLAYRHGIVLLGYPGSDAGTLASRCTDSQDMVVAAGPGYLRIKPPSSDCAATVLTLPFPSEARLMAATGKIMSEEAGQLDYARRIGRLLNDLAAEHFSAETINLVAAHFFVQGGWTSDSERILQLGAAMLVNPEYLPATAQYIALGHLHRPQAVTGCPSPARYAGSPLAYSFSESGYAKSVCLVDAFPGQPAVIQTIPLASGKPLRRWQAREGLDQAMAWARDGRDAGCWIDVEITAERLLTASEILALRDLNPGILYIRVSLDTGGRAASEPASRQGRRIEELFAEYYRYRNGVPIPEDVMATFLSMVNQEPEVTA